MIGLLVPVLGIFLDQILGLFGPGPVLGMYLDQILYLFGLDLNLGQILGILGPGPKPILCLLGPDPVLGICLDQILGHFDPVLVLNLGILNPVLVLWDPMIVKFVILYPVLGL